MGLPERLESPHNKGRRRVSLAWGHSILFVAGLPWESVSGNRRVMIERVELLKHHLWDRLHNIRFSPAHR